MVRVVIQPSYGNPAARRHWADTMDREVDLTTLEVTPEVRERLDTVHPSGRSAVWGTTASHNSRMDTLHEGDVVLFTGQKKVRAIGEIGVVFRDEAVGNALWDPDGDRGSYVNVYTLRSVQRVDIPYDEIWALPGFNAGDNFMGTRFLDDDKSQTILDGLRITTGLEREAAERTDTGNPDAPLQPTAIEQVHTSSAEFARSARTIIVNRTEGLLVHRYTTSLGAVSFGRHQTLVGITDINVDTGLGIELVEAKSSVSRDSVRQAVGQLLEYLPHCPDVTSMAVLLPHSPPQSVLDYLHRWGIHALWETTEGTFTRSNAPDANSLVPHANP